MAKADDTGLVPVPIRFPRDLYERLRRHAFETDTPMSVIVRDAVDKELHEPAG